MCDQLAMAARVNYNDVKAHQLSLIKQDYLKWRALIPADIASVPIVKGLLIKQLYNGLIF